MADTGVLNTPAQLGVQVRVLLSALGFAKKHWELLKARTGCVAKHPQRVHHASFGEVFCRRQVPIFESPL